MLWSLIWILGLLVFMLVVIIYTISQGFDLEGLGAGIICGLLTSSISFAIILIVTGIIGDSADKTYVVTNENQIYANAENKYVTMDNGSKQFKVYIDDIRTKHIDVGQSSTDIIEEGDSYYIKEYSQVYVSEKVKWLLGENGTDTNTKYEICIPKGSISTENNISLLPKIK